jgi:hypothetical protein
MAATTVLTSYFLRHQRAKQLGSLADRVLIRKVDHSGKFVRISD